MKTLSSKYTLLALVALALGLVLLFVAPAMAKVVHTVVDKTGSGTDFDYEIDIVALAGGGDLELPPAFYEINAFGGDAEFRVDAINFFDPATQTWAYGQVSGLFSNDPDKHNYVVGDYVKQSVDIGDLKNLLDPIPPSSTILVDIPIIKKLGPDVEIGDFANLGSELKYCDKEDTLIKQVIGFDLGGFSAELHVDLPGWVQFLIEMSIPKIDAPPISDPYTPYGEFINTDGFYAGFQFEDDQNEIHYGWLKIAESYAAGKITGFTVYEWAFEDVAGASILTGQIEGGVVPIPGSILLLGSGLMGLGLLGWRRKSKG